MNGTDNTAEEDPLLSIDSSSGHTSAPISSASTSSMTAANTDDDADDERRSFQQSSRGDDDTDPARKHHNRTKITFFGSKRGVWVRHSRLLCLVMVLDLMTMSVQIPSLTAAFESHGMDLRWQGWVASVYGIISFFVGPMLGRVSDSVGRVAMLRMSCAGSMLGALGSLNATGRWTFIAARTLPALLKCSLPISQAYIVDVSQGSAERSKNLGMLGASFGVAFVLGPPLGGTAADYDIRLPFVIAFLECVLLYFALQFLPEPANKGGASVQLDDGGGGGGVKKNESSVHDVGKGGGNGGGADQAEVVTATTTSSSSSSLAWTSTSMKRVSSLTRIKSSLMMPSDHGKASTLASATSKGAMTRTRSRSSMLMAAAENGKGKASPDATVGEARVATGGNGSGGGGGGQGMSLRTSPARARAKTLTATAIGVASAGAAPAATPGGGGGSSAASGVAGGRLGIFRGPGGRQMGWGFHDRFFLVVAEGIYHTSFAPFLTSVLAYPTSTVGMLLSFMGMVAALTNAFLVGELTKRFGERPLMASSLMVLALGWVMWSTVSGSLPSLLVSLTMAGVGGNVFQTVNKASVAQHAPPELVGTVMGTSAALETFGRSLAGPMSGYLFDAVGARGVPLSCSCAAAYVAVVLTVRGFADVMRGGEVAGGESGGDGSHRRDNKTYIKRSCTICMSALE
eukprot:g14965.t1